MSPQGGTISAVLPATAPADASNVVLYNVPCDASVYVKAAVRMSSGTAVNALADTVANSNVLGICEAKSSSTLCTVRVLGVSPGIFTGLDETQEYYLSAAVAGDITTTPPTASGNVVVKLGQPYSATEFLVLKGVRMVRA